MCAGDASRVSGAGVLTLQWGIATVMMGKRAATLMAQVHVKRRVAADERESSRVTSQAMHTGTLARKPHEIRSRTTPDPDITYPPLRASSIIARSRCHS